MDWLSGLIQAGLGAYNIYQNKQNNDKYRDWLYDREDANYQRAQDLQEWYEEEAEANSETANDAISMIAEQMAAEREAMQPFLDTAKELLPIQSKAYQGGLSDLSKVLEGYIMSPEVQNKIATVKSPSETNVRLPSYMRK